jgi:hypothetical protein
VVALYAAGITDPKTLAYAFVTAFIAPIWKSLDPKAKEFGRGAK